MLTSLRRVGAVMLPAVTLSACIAEMPDDMDSPEEAGESSTGETTVPSELPPDTDKYIGGWGVGHCQDEVVPTGGSAKGDVAPDFFLVDQFGETLRLYDFCHQVIFLEMSAEW